MKEKAKMRKALSPADRWVVLFRDEFTCQECGKRGKFRLFGAFSITHPRGMFCDLEVHHIKDATVNDFDNLITLCSDCHFDVHEGDWKHKPIKTFIPRPITQEVIEKGRADYYDREKTISRIQMRQVVPPEFWEGMDLV